MKKIFIIVPTASGKTELAKFIFDNFKTEIISVDSAQIYQGMNIGSANQVHQSSIAIHII